METKCIKCLNVWTPEDVLEMDTNHMNELNAIRNEMQLRIDELEELLEIETELKKSHEKQIGDQLDSIQQLRDIRDNSVDIRDYQALKDKYNKLCTQLSQTQDMNDLLSARLEVYETNESEEWEVSEVETLTQEVDELKAYVRVLTEKIGIQKREMEKLNVLKHLNRDLESDLKRERAENAKLNEILNTIREDQLKHNELNISVDGINFDNFVNSLNVGSLGESMDCILNTKIEELEVALENKRQEMSNILSLNEEMKNKMSELETNLEKKTRDYESIVSVSVSEVQKSKKYINPLKGNCSQLESALKKCHKMQTRPTRTPMDARPLILSKTNRKLPIGTGSRKTAIDQVIGLKRMDCSSSHPLVGDHRLSVLQKRNAMTSPQMKSSYPAEPMDNVVDSEIIKHGLKGVKRGGEDIHSCTPNKK